MHVDLVTCSNPRNALKVVVFDNYEVAITKGHEKKRCRLQSDYSADVSVTSNILIPGNKSAFLYNQCNKQSFINILGRSLERNDITVAHAKDMVDGDVTIIKETLTLAEAYKCVQVVADDTDIFIYLLFHSTQDTAIIIRTKRDCITVRKVQESLGKSLIVCLLFAHSVSGRYTTSFYDIRKLKTMKLLKGSEVQCS